MGFSGAWRPISRVIKSAVLIPRAKADREFKSKQKKLGVVLAGTFTAHLVYFANPNGRFLVPYYLYRAQSVNGKHRLLLRDTLIPATSFDAPMAIAPKPNRRKPPAKEFLIPESKESSLIRREMAASWIADMGANCQGFLDVLKKDGWYEHFNHGNEYALETDWSTSDDLWVDAVDIIFYSGHAKTKGWRVHPPNDRTLRFDDVGGPPDRYGVQDLEWIVIAACGPLQDSRITGEPLDGSVFSRWTGLFDGLHQLLGYGSRSMETDNEGRRFAKYCVQGHTTIQAWFRAGKETQPVHMPDGEKLYSGVLFGYRYGEMSPFRDHLWGYGWVAPDPKKPTYS